MTPLQYAEEIVPQIELGVLPKDQWLLQRSGLEGVFVGGCISRGVGSRFRAKAHAHIDGKHKGWICFRSAKWLHLPELWLHEIAHIIAGVGHTDEWRKVLLDIGGTLDFVDDPISGERHVLRSYHKRGRHG